METLHTINHESDAIATWAGECPDALRLAEEGVRRFGAPRWYETYALDPRRALLALGGGHLLLRWRRTLQELSVGARWHLQCISQSPSGLDLNTLLDSVDGEDTGVILDELVRTRWVEWAGSRCRVPPMRRHLVASNWGMPNPAQKALDEWFVRYIRCRMERSDRSWTPDEITCLAQCVSQPRRAARLSDQDALQAVSRLRHTAHAPTAVALLRQRLSDPSVEAPRLELTRALAGALIDSGTYEESAWLLKDGSRTSETMRAHALIRMGATADAMRGLQQLGHEDDTHWELQWALGLSYQGKGARAERILQRQLTAAREARHRGLIWAVLGETRERLSSGSTHIAYEYAIDALDDAGDELARSYCQARYARVLSRSGRFDRARACAHAAWSNAARLHSEVLQGIAALACTESGLVSTEMVASALTAAQHSEVKELAADATRALHSSPRRPTLVVSPAGTMLDGAPIDIPAHGPVARVLDHLAQRPPELPASIPELFAAGWPGEHAHPTSQKKRVQTAIWTLRRAGLRSVLETARRNHYRLDADVLRID